MGRSLIHAKRKRISSNLRQFMLPVVIVSGRIDVNRFASSSMEGKIRLAVTVEVERSEHDTACHRLLKIPVDTGSPLLMTTRGRLTLTTFRFLEHSQYVLNDQILIFLHFGES
jgi:hypothetical protein